MIRLDYRTQVKSTIQIIQSTLSVFPEQTDRVISDICARTACPHTPGNLYTRMTCTPLISIDAEGINQDFRCEIGKICAAHLRGGSGATEQPLCAHVCPFVHSAINHLCFFHSSFPPSLNYVFRKTRRWRKAALPHSSAFMSLGGGRGGEKCAVLCSRPSEEVLAYKQETVRTVDVTAPGEVEVHPTSNTQSYSSKPFTEFTTRTQFLNR